MRRQMTTVPVFDRLRRELNGEPVEPSAERLRREPAERLRVLVLPTEVAVPDESSHESSHVMMTSHHIGCYNQFERETSALREGRTIR
jgi:hypothetical protein